MAAGRCRSGSCAGRRRRGLAVEQLSWCLLRQSEARTPGGTPRSRRRGITGSADAPREEPRETCESSSPSVVRGRALGEAVPIAQPNGQTRSGGVDDGSLWSGARPPYPSRRRWPQTWQTPVHSRPVTIVFPARLRLPAHSGARSRAANTSLIPSISSEELHDDNRGFYGSLDGRKASSRPAAGHTPAGLLSTGQPPRVGRRRGLRFRAWGPPTPTRPSKSLAAAPTSIVVRSSDARSRVSFSSRSSAATR